MFSVTAPLAQVPSHNRCEALHVEPNNEDDGSFSMEMSLTLRWSTPSVKTVCINRERHAIVIGDSLLKGIEIPICQKDPLRRKSAAFLVVRLKM